MKIETPQILWHATDNGKNAPLLSLSILQYSCSKKNPNLTDMDNVVATSGNTPEVNLWKISLGSPLSISGTNTSIASVTQTQIPTKHILSLTRNQRCTNTLAFSPDGTTLATAGDGGSILLYSIPSSSISSSQTNDSHLDWWYHLEKESDLHCLIIKSSPTEDVMDLTWDHDSRRFAVGCMDHEILVYEKDSSSEINFNCDYKCIWRKRDHTSYVQGVAFDPLGVYLASQGSDRTMKVYTRKPPKVKKNDNSSINPKWKDTKFETGKSKTVKYLNLDESKFSDHSTSKTVTTLNETPGTNKRVHLFAEESIVESFFRRLSWTPDGAFLIAPTALWHCKDDPTVCSNPNSQLKENTNLQSSHETEEQSQKTPQSMSSSPSFATYLFPRHHFDRPAAVLNGLDKPSVVVKSNPVLFTLPLVADVSKTPNHKWNLSYRTIFAVLTLDTIFIYDTFHLTPIAMARGLHYAGLTDCEWTNDGRHLLVTSSDGYISILSFTDGELGIPYQKKEELLKEKVREQNDPYLAANHENLPQSTEINSSQAQIPEIKMMQVKKKEKRKKKRIALTQVSVEGGNVVNNDKSEKNLDTVRDKLQPLQNLNDDVVMEDVSKPMHNKRDAEPLQETMITTNLYNTESSSATKPAVSVKKMKKKRIQPIQLS